MKTSESVATRVSGQRDELLIEAIAEYQAALDSGDPPDRAAFVNRFPEIAADLADCLDNLHFLRSIAPQLNADPAPPVVPGSPDVSAVRESPDPASPSVVRGSPDPSVVRGSPDPAHPASSTLGDFRIVREIGRGGMGVVYEALQLSIGRRVALKVLPFAAMLDKRQLNRFHNEARAAGTLDHANIVAIHSVGCDRGVHYYAMQLIEGQSLAQVIEGLRAGSSPTPTDRQESSGVEEQRSSGAEQQSYASTPLLHYSSSAPSYSTTPLLHYSSTPTPVRPPSDSAAAPPAASQAQPPAGDTARAALSTLRSSDSAAFFRTVVQLGVQAAEALDHAHQNGVLHRDIKPANLLVDDSGKLWITDFGLARIETGAGMTMTGDILGTLRYMSPEQALAKRAIVDHRSDIYSLGVTLYELFTLQPAFAGDDRQELLRQIACDDPRSPKQINPQVPIDLETIVLKAIEKNPADRYATAQALADDLRRFLASEPIRASRPSKVDHMRKWCRRHTALVQVAIAALTIIALTASGATFLTLRAYRSEASQRQLAHDNLLVAADSIDAMLSRFSEERYLRGHLEHAEVLAADASRFYGKLLHNSDDSALRLRAIQANENIARIWGLLDKSEKAAAIHRHNIDLLRPLVMDSPENPKYLQALGQAYLGLASTMLADDLPNMQTPAAQACAIFEDLVKRYPQDLDYKMHLSGALVKLGIFSVATGAAAEAEELVRRAVAIQESLPEQLKASQAGLEMRAATKNDLAFMVLAQGGYSGALKMFHEALGLEQQALTGMPRHPMATGFLYKHHLNLATTHLLAGNDAQAASVVQSAVAQFPNKLSAYYDGASILLGCAQLAQLRAGLPFPNNLDLFSSRMSAALAYRKRARELVQQADRAKVRRPDEMEGFAQFLLTSEDEALRDPSRAVKLAQAAVEAVPTRGSAWFTLALARYRNGDLNAAEQALVEAEKCPLRGRSTLREAALLSLIRAQERDVDGARLLYNKAHAVVRSGHTGDPLLHELTSEAGDLIRSKETSGVKPTAIREHGPAVGLTKD